MLALLCSFVNLALTGSLTQAALIVFTLLQASEIPIPVPQIAIPQSTSLSLTASASLFPAIG